MEITIKFVYPGLKFVSDRTFRQSLRLASQAIHEILVEEIDYVIATSGLNLRQRQSLADRVGRQLDHIPNYYIEAVRRGSLEIAVGVSAVAFWVLKETLGESVKEGWKRSEFHHRLVRFLSNTSATDEGDQEAPTTPEPSAMIHLGSLGERWVRLEREVRSRFEVSRIYGNFQVTAVSVEPGEANEMVFRIEFDVADEVLVRQVAFERIDFARVIEAVERDLEIAETDPAQDSAEGN